MLRDLVGLTVEDLRLELAEAKHLQAVLDARVLEIVSLLGATMSAIDSPVRAIPEDELIAHSGMSRRAAGGTVRRAHLIEEGPLFGEALTEGIISVVLNGTDVPLDIGRTQRLASAGQRRALEAAHTTCAMPDCEGSFHHCQIHHIEYWENGGATDLNNTVPLCSRHHHAAHEGGWTLQLDPKSRILTATAPRPGRGP